MGVKRFEASFTANFSSIERAGQEIASNWL